MKYPYRMKKFIRLISSLFILSFFFSCATTTTNLKGYKIMNYNRPDDRGFNKEGIAPVYCNNERAYSIVDIDLKVSTLLVFVEKGTNDNKYFGVAEYNESIGGYVGDRTFNHNYHIEIPKGAKRYYLEKDQILPEKEAIKISNTVLFLFGHVTGGGNLSTRAYQKQEELRVGQELRAEPINTWKIKYPDIYKMIITRLPYWEKYDDAVKVWLAKIVRSENLKDYDSLLTYVDSLKTNVKISMPYRGEDAIPLIAPTADSLFRKGKINSQGLTKILNYIQINNGMLIFQFMIENNLTAEEFCLGVNSGKFFLTN